MVNAKEVGISATKNSGSTIYVVDDDKAVQESVAVALRPLGHQVESFLSAESFLESWNAQGPGCVLLDVRMEGMSGIELQRILAKEAPYLSVVMVTGHATISLSVSTLKNGATDFLEKPYDPDQLRASVRSAVDRSRMHWTCFQNQIAYQSYLEGLSPREVEVHQLLLDGLESKQIALALGISPSTAEKHRLAVVRKMGVDNVAQLIRQRMDTTLVES